MSKCVNCINLNTIKCRICSRNLKKLMNFNNLNGIDNYEEKHIIISGKKHYLDKNNISDDFYDVLDESIEEYNEAIKNMGDD